MVLSKILAYWEGETRKMKSSNMNDLLALFLIEDLRQEEKRMHINLYIEPLCILMLWLMWIDQYVSKIEIMDKIYVIMSLLQRGDK